MSWGETDAESSRQGLAYSVARDGSENLNLPTFFIEIQVYFAICGNTFTRMLW
jgi:hypothetical protein